MFVDLQELDLLWRQKYELPSSILFQLTLNGSKLKSVVCYSLLQHAVESQSTSVLSVTQTLGQPTTPSNTTTQPQQYMLQQLINISMYTSASKCSFSKCAFLGVVSANRVQHCLMSPSRRQMLIWTASANRWSLLVKLFGHQIFKSLCALCWGVEKWKQQAGVRIGS